MTAHDIALADLSKQQNRLSRLLIAEVRDVQAIAEQADVVRRAEQRAREAERCRR